MPQRSTIQAIVARTLDIGEADRFCILFSRERGKLAARAPGVRKPTSRMGGSLLPLRCVQAEVTEGRGGMLVTSARLAADAIPAPASLAAFARMEQGMETLLALTEDDHPLPEVYDLTVQFLTLCGEADPLPSYQLRLLHLLGLLPSEDEEPRFDALTDKGRAFVRAAVREERLADVLAAQDASEETARFRVVLLAEHLSRPLKSAQVAPSLEGI